MTAENARDDLRQRVRALATDLQPEIEAAHRDGSLPHGAIRRMQDEGLTSLLIPREFGGAGADMVSFCVAQHEFARVDLGLSNFISDQAVPAQMLRHHATPEQQKTYFDRVVNEPALWCLSVTEPNVGSDLSSIETTATREDHEYVIDGHKTWASAGGIAQIYVVLASTKRDLGLKGLTAFLVDREADGFSVGRELPKLGWRTTSTTELHLDGVRVDASAIVGEEGGGFGLFETALTAGRLGIAAQATGMLEAALDYAVSYARERKQFGRRIGDFQAIRFMLADMAAAVETSRLLTYRAAEAADAGDAEAGKLVAMAKYWVSDAAMQVTTDAVQVLGAAGYSSDHPVERMMRDAKGLQIADGTNQIMRVLVGRDLLGR